jgi:2-amino-4-hydroxy-6-hydroxymethyldihydropteridine diphosphokinase
MTTVYIGIGSNLGEKHENCLKAIEMIEEIPGCETVKQSDLYLTKPVGVEDQDWYVNGVITLQTNISPQDLLHHLMSIEEKMGRVRRERWESRIIDLDILFFGQEIIHEENLTVPHPRLHLRRFVLIPMTQIAPDFIHPSLGLTMAQLSGKCPEDGQVVIPAKE